MGRGTIDSLLFTLTTKGRKILMAINDNYCRLMSIVKQTLDIMSIACHFNLQIFDKSNVMSLPSIHRNSFVMFSWKTSKFSSTESLRFLSWNQQNVRECKSFEVIIGNSKLEGKFNSSNIYIKMLSRKSSYEFGDITIFICTSFVVFHSEAINV